MATPITDITGIGPSNSVTLAEHGFKTVAKLAATSIDSLCKVPGFGPIKAKAAIAEAKRVTRTKQTAAKKAAKKPKAKPKKKAKKTPKPKAEKKKKAKKDSKKKSKKSKTKSKSSKSTKSKQKKSGKKKKK